MTMKESWYPAMEEINRYYHVNCEQDEFLDFVEEYQKRLNSLADELIHLQYATLIVEDEYATVAQRLGYDIASPIKNYKKSDLSLVSTVYYRLVDADDKIRKSKTTILEDFNYMAKLSFEKVGLSHYIKVSAVQPLYFELLESNPQVRRLQEDASILSRINFDYSFTRELYTNIRGIRPRALLEALNERYTYLKRIRTLSERILELELSQTTSYIQKSETERKAFLVSPDCRVRLQAIATSVEPFIQGTYTPEYLLQKK